MVSAAPLSFITLVIQYMSVAWDFLLQTLIVFFLITKIGDWTIADYRFSILGYHEIFVRIFFFLASKLSILDVYLIA